MNENLSEQVAPSIWWGWGDPAKAGSLSPDAEKMLRDEYGVDPAPTFPPVSLEQVRMPESALEADDLRALRGTDSDVLLDTGDRASHSGGKSYPDLYRRRTGDCEDAPDAVVCPRSEQAIADILAICVERNLAVVPYGGGTSVVGGLEPLRGGKRALLSLDLRHLASMTDLDENNRTATFGAGIRGPAIEAALRGHKLTLGHYPQSHQQASLGGYVATRSAGQSSTGYGRSDELVQRVRVITPRGPIDLGSDVPASAAGPKLIDLLIGSEGTLGVISEVTMHVHSAPATKKYAAWAFESFAGGARALQAAAHECGKNQLPAVCRLSDAEETRIGLVMSGGLKAKAVSKYLDVRGASKPALGLFVWEGDDDVTALAKKKVEKVLSSHGGIRLGGTAAKSWEHGRFASPYLRDVLMSRGVFVETLETAASWSRLQATYLTVQSAIEEALGSPSSVQCHISHVYDAGASLYFTFLARAEDDPLAQWRRVKTAASEAIVDAGATITHHHAVGTDHAPYLSHEIGDLGLDVLRAVKSTLDPAGVLNPGKLMRSAEDA